MECAANAHTAAETSTAPTVRLGSSRSGSGSVEPDLEPNRLRLVRVVLDDQVFVEAVRDEAVAADGHGLSGRTTDDPGRVVVDCGPGERVDRLAVDEHLPEREMPDVFVEEAFVPFRVDVARGFGVEERRPVEDRQVGHARFAA